MDRRIREQLDDLYRRRRAENKAEEGRRREEIRVRAPDVQACVDRRQAQIGDFCARALADPAFRPDPDALREAERRVREALRKAGYPEDYLDPVVQCPLCGDTGRVDGRDCECLRRSLFDLTNTVGGQGESFETFDETVFPVTKPEGLGISQREEMRRLRTYCETYADTFPAQRPRDLLLYGPSGLGKSFLLNCVARRLQERGYGAELVSAYDVIRIMRDAYFGRGDDTDRLYEADALLIDDLGMEPMMENITIEQLFQLVNVRRSRGLALVISTNLNMEEIKQRYTERLASRLFDRSLCQVVRLAGDDVRQRRRGAAGE